MPSYTVGKLRPRAQCPNHLLCQVQICRLGTAPAEASAATQPTAPLDALQPAPAYKGDIHMSVRECTCTLDQKNLTQHNHFWGHKGHYTMDLEPEGPSELLLFLVKGS